MKKTYISPSVKIASIHFMPLLAGSIPVEEEVYNPEDYELNSKKGWNGNWE